MDFDEYTISDVDRQLWDVFSRFVKVTQLDLASLHDIVHEPYIRRSPDRLFPAVMQLQLVGWMHRGLVRAIFASLDVSKLSVLKLDHLQDEGAFPDGEHSCRGLPHDQFSAGTLDLVFDEKLDRCDHPPLDESVIHAQETGDAIIFPGPMWFPFRCLQDRPTTGLRRLHIRLPPFDEFVDIQAYYTLFSEICKATKRFVTIPVCTMHMLTKLLSSVTVSETHFKTFRSLKESHFGYTVMIQNISRAHVTSMTFNSETYTCRGAPE